MENKKLAVITGPTGNLGPIWCETVLEKGYQVFGIDLPEFDVSDEKAVKRAKAICSEECGIPSLIVLSAGIDNPPDLPGTRFNSDFDRILAVNLKGAVNVAKVFLPMMIANGGGLIVGVSSIQARVGADWRNYEIGFQKPVAYNLSKAGLEQYVRSLTVQYGRYNIRACCIGFGAYDEDDQILEPRFKMRYLANVPLMRPVSRESAKAALTFAIDCPEFAGQTVLIDGGYTAL